MIAEPEVPPLDFSLEFEVKGGLTIPTHKRLLIIPFPVL